MGEELERDPSKWLERSPGLERELAIQRAILDLALRELARISESDPPDPSLRLWLETASRLSSRVVSTAEVLAKYQSQVTWQVVQSVIASVVDSVISSLGRYLVENHLVEVEQSDWEARRFVHDYFVPEWEQRSAAAGWREVGEGSDLR
jgi:hypothetical protein